jgi:hypothetical protein
VGQAERLWRWCRRNPKLAAASGLAAAALVAVTVISTLFAIQQAVHADRLGKEQQRTKDALETAERNHREAELHAASLAVDIDLQHCEHGEIENGILGLARTLKAVPPDATDLRQCIEMNLLAWSQELRPLGPTFQYDGSETQWALSPDGLTVLTGGADGTARLWDAFTGEVRATMRSDHGQITSVAFSQNGQVAMTVGDYRTVQLWDSADGRARAVIANDRKGFEKIFLSPDGKRLLTYYSDPPGDFPTDMTGRTVVTLWDTATGQRIKDLTGHAGRVNAAVFGPDGKMILTGGADKTARLWSADSGDYLATLKGSLGAITAVAFSPDGALATTLELEVDQKQQTSGSRARWWDPHRAVQIGTACFSKKTWGEFRFIHPDVAVLGSAGTTPVVFVQGMNEGIEIEMHVPPCKADNDYLLGSEGRLFDRTSGKQRAVPAGRRFSDDLARFATEGRFFVSVSTSIVLPASALGPGYKTERSLIDLRTEKAIGKTNASEGDLRHVPDRKTFVAVSWPSPRYIPIPDTPLDAEVARLFAEVVTCQELDPAGNLRPLDEAEWEERRERLTERLREHPASFLVDRLAADRWHWLRRKLAGAKTDAERFKYLDRLIAVEPTWKNYEQRAQVHYFGYYPWDSQEPRKVPDEAASRKFAAEAARDLLEAGNRAGPGYWHQFHYYTNNGPENWLFRLAEGLTRPNNATSDQYDLGLQLAEALHTANPDDRYRRRILAKALYRVGRYAEALPLLPQREWERHCISQFGQLFLSPWNAALVEKEVDVNDYRILEEMAYLAMTYHRLGHPDQAQAVLAHLRTLGTWANFPSRLFHTIGNWYPDLLREAKALIEGK